MVFSEIYIFLRKKLAHLKLSRKQLLLDFR